MKYEEISSEDFYCSLIGQNVSVTKTYPLHQNSITKQIDKKFTPEFECDSKKECGVQDASGSLDWYKCVHPEGKISLS